MPAQSSIVVNDGQGTPVAHTFVPNGAIAQPDRKVTAEWVDRSQGTEVGNWYIREQYSPPNGNGIAKMRFTIERPVLEVLGSTVVGFNPAPTRAYLPMAVIEYLMPTRASAAELQDLAALVKNFTALTLVTDKVKNRERSW